MPPIVKIPLSPSVVPGHLGQPSRAPATIGRRGLIQSHTYPRATPSTFRDRAIVVPSDILTCNPAQDVCVDARVPQNSIDFPSSDFSSYEFPSCRTLSTNSSNPSKSNSSTSVVVDGVERKVVECGRESESESPSVVSFVRPVRKVSLRRSRSALCPSVPSITQPAYTQAELRAWAKSLGESDPFPESSDVELEPRQFITLKHPVYTQDELRAWAKSLGEPDPFPESSVLEPEPELRQLITLKYPAYTQDELRAWAKSLGLSDSELESPFRSVKLKGTRAELPDISKDSFSDSSESEMDMPDPFLSVRSSSAQDELPYEFFPGKPIPGSSGLEQDLTGPMPPLSPFPFLSYRAQAAALGIFFPSSESSVAEEEEPSTLSLDSPLASPSIRAQAAALGIFFPPSESSDVVAEDDLSHLHIASELIIRRHPNAARLGAAVEALERGQCPVFAVRVAGSDSSFSGTEYSLSSYESEMNEESHSSDLVPVLSPCMKFSLLEHFSFPSPIPFTDGPVCHLPVEDCLHCYGQVENSLSVFSDSNLSGVIAVGLSDVFAPSSLEPFTIHSTTSQAVYRKALYFPSSTTEIDDISVDEIFPFDICTHSDSETDDNDADADDYTIPSIPGAWLEEEETVAQSWASKLVVTGILAASAVVASWAFSSLF